MKNYVLTMMLLVSVTTLRAQEKMPPHDRIESYKIAFITEKLDLSSKEAQAFWPVYNEYNDQLQAMRAKEREKGNAFRKLENPTNAESDKFILEHLTFRQQELDHVKKYVAEFKKVLPDAKVAKLITLEHEFKMQLLHKIKERGHYERK